jgi:hypothetical protein
MIFEKRGMWKISGQPQKYATYDEAHAALEKINAMALVVEDRRKAENDLKAAAKATADEERAKKLAQLAEDSTPYEKMIVKNICIICDMEPCECFTYTKKTDLGE